MSENIAIDMEQVKETFFIESDEHISNMESLILELEGRPDDTEILNGIFRAAHSMKGNSACLGMKDINRFTHSLETVLDRLRTGKKDVNADVISILLRSLDCIKGLVECAKAGADAGPEVDATLNALKDLLEKKDDMAPLAARDTAAPAACAFAESAERVLRITFAPGPEIMKRGIDPVDYLKGLGELGSVISEEIDFSKVPCLDEMEPDVCFLSWEILLLTANDAAEVKSFFEFVSEGSYLSIEAIGGAATASQAAATSSTERKKLGEILVEEKIITTDELNKALKKQNTHHKEEAATIRVDIDKVDRLVDFVGEFVITQSMITRLSYAPTPENFSQLKSIAAQLERNTREIQEKVMSIRMLPIGTVFNRFSRLVRDLSHSSGKKIDLDIVGGKTELDKIVIEKITDPLTHLIRNSVDHGVETPDERLGKGKPETGLLRFSAFHAGGYVLVSVEDDGKGLDKERIITKALDRGLAEEQALRQMTDAEIFGLIFLPGFSTAEKVTDISGRGVGMDVVKRNIEALGGSVSVESKKDEFTRISLRLPLTLAIIDGLTVKVGDETFVLPINAVVESLRPGREDVRSALGTGHTVHIRGSHLPVIGIHTLFGITPRSHEPWNALVVVVNSKTGTFALLVDDLVGEQQIVIKNIGEAFRDLPGVSGATILGDGRVALILDIEGLVKKFQGR